MPKAAAGAERPMMDGGDGYIAEIEIPRGDLSRVLHDDTRDGVEYVFGDRIAALTQDADGVTATSQAQKRLLRDRMAGLGWLTRRILTHLDDTPDFYLDQVAQVVMDRWSIGRVGLLGDAAFSSSPMSGAGTGLALVGAYLLAGELATAGWDPEAGFAGYERRMRSYVEATQEIGRLHVRSRDVPGPDIVSTANGAPNWSSVRSTASSCPTTQECRTSGPRPDRRSPRRRSRRCHITGGEGRRFGRSLPDSEAVMQSVIALIAWQP
jgi:2-polyprenyl-6-methoxyphenol hydroxylase-like FAD-dependent oxidoreductase